MLSQLSLYLLSFSDLSCCDVSHQPQNKKRWTDWFTAPKNSTTVCVYRNNILTTDTQLSAVFPPSTFYWRKSRNSFVKDSLLLEHQLNSIHLHCRGGRSSFRCWHLIKTETKLSTWLNTSNYICCNRWTGPNKRLFGPSNEKSRIVWPEGETDWWREKEILPFLFLTIQKTFM